MLVHLSWKRRLLLTSTILAALAASPYLAHAQDTTQASGQNAMQSSSDDQVIEVVVTAQKRKENVQSVPIAITALSAMALQDRGLTNVTQISDLSPNIHIDNASPFAGSSQIVSAYVRGIGQNDFAFNMEPGVGLYVDGVYFARTVGAAQDLLDIDHVEILKGPQGTLFGRNTIGGAVSVVTADPKNSFDFKSEVTAGAFSRLDARVTVDIPLIDNKLLSSVSFSSKTRDGYQKRIAFPGASAYDTDLGRFYTSEAPGGDDRQGNENAQTLRAKLLWIVSDSFRLNLSVDGTRAREEAAPESLLDVQVNYSAPGPQQTIATIYNECLMGAPIPMCQNIATTGSNLVGANRLPYDNRFVTGDIDTTYAKGSNYSDIDTGGAALTADWTLSDTLKLRSISGYRSLVGRFGTDLGGAPFVVGDTSFTMKQKQVSEELQLNLTAFGGRLRSLVGAYYFHESGSLLDTVPFLEGLIQVYGPNDFRNESIAVFTHNNFDITDKLSVTVGVRYTQEDKWFDGRQQDLNMFALKAGYPQVFYPDQNDLTLIYPKGPHSVQFNNVSSRLGVNYRFTPRVMAYVSYAQGFKSGGWTTRLTAPTMDNIAPGFTPELADTYELGIKSELFDRHLRLNVAAFDTDYQNMQVTVTQGVSPTFFNGGSAKIRGVEIEATARPTSGLTVDASVGYIDAHYTSITAPSTGTVLLNLKDKLVNTPDWTANLGIAYRQEIGSAGWLKYRVDYSFKSGMAKDTINTPMLMQKSVSLWNPTVTWQPANANWEIAAGVSNATDQRYLVTGNANAAIGLTAGTYSRPREYFVTLRFRS